MDRSAQLRVYHPGSRGGTIAVRDDFRRLSLRQIVGPNVPPITAFNLPICGNSQAFILISSLYR